MSSDPAGEHAAGGAGVDRLAGAFHACGHTILELAVGGLVSGDPGGGVEQHGVAHGRLLTVHDALEDSGVERRVAPGQRGRLGLLEPESLRIELVVGDLAGGWVAHPDPRRRGGGDLVESVVTAEDQRIGAPGGENTGHDRRHPGLGHADGHRVRTGRVHQGPEEVERGGDAELTAWHRSKPERRMEHRGEAERDADLRQHVDELGRRDVQPDADLLEDVGRATGAGRGPVAVLDDRDSRAGDHHGRHGRDVDGARAVAAGADDVDDATLDLHGRGVAIHGVDESLHLRLRLALAAESDGESGDLGRSGVAGQDLVHRPRGGRDVEVVPRDELCQDIWPRVHGWL